MTSPEDPALVLVEHAQTKGVKLQRRTIRVFRGEDVAKGEFPVHFSFRKHFPVFGDNA